MNLSEKKKHFNKGIELFNSQKFYEAHEEWETIWLKEKGELRNFYQGLIILAGALHHVQKGRLEPAKKALDKAIMKLSGYSKKKSKIKLELLLNKAKDVLDQLNDDGIYYQKFPQIE